MAEITVESIFGMNAGIVWKALNKNGPCTIEDLVETTSLNREEVHGALGWLGRENKDLGKDAREDKRQDGKSLLFTAVRLGSSLGCFPPGLNSLLLSLVQRAVDILN